MQIKRKNSLLWGLIISSTLLLSCQSGKKNTAIVKADVSCQPLLSNELMLGAPNAVALSGSVLAITDTQSDSLIHFVDIEKQKAIQKAGSLGQGPNEFTMITSLNPGKNHSFHLYDPNKRTLYQMDSTTDGTSFTPLFHIDSLMHYEVRPLADHSNVATGIYEKNRFRLVDAQGQIKKSFGEWPYRDEKEKNLSGRVKAQAYMGGLTVSPSGTKFLSYVATADILSFYQLEKGEIQLVKENCLTYPDYAYNDPSSSFRGTSPKAPLTYLAAASTEKHVYVLYSGKSTDKYDLGAFNGKMIYVYNWDGEKVAELKSDQDLSCLCVSPNGKAIYTIANMPEPTLVKIDLPELK